ncbi:MAG: 3-deoxy-D-manno-octulosonic acid transferase, partial [Burkholderiales bacterium]
LPYGAQNLIEACAAGRPVLIGPHVYNFDEAVRLAVEAGAAIRVRDADELMREARLLLEDQSGAQKMGRLGLEFCAVHRGATQRVLELIRPHLGIG